MSKFLSTFVILSLDGTLLKWKNKKNWIRNSNQPSPSYKGGLSSPKLSAQNMICNQLVVISKFRPILGEP